MTHTDNDDNKISYILLLEVKELRRTPTKSYIEVVDYKSINNGGINQYRDDPRSDFFVGVSRLYNGWIDISSVEWVQEINGREEIIDKLLEEIEEETIK